MSSQLLPKGRSSTILLSSIAISAEIELYIKVHQMMLLMRLGKNYTTAGTSLLLTAFCLKLVIDIGLSQIDKESAAKLPNATAPISGEGGIYIVGLDVFHQLHCLVSTVAFQMSD